MATVDTDVQESSVAVGGSNTDIQWGPKVSTTNKNASFFVFL